MRRAECVLSATSLAPSVCACRPPLPAASRIRDYLDEKKNADVSHGAHIDELQRYHRAYKRAFVRGDAMGTIVWLLGRALSVPEDVRSEDEARAPTISPCRPLFPYMVTIGAQ